MNNVRPVSRWTENAVPIVLGNLETMEFENYCLDVLSENGYSTILTSLGLPFLLVP